MKTRKQLERENRELRSCVVVGIVGILIIGAMAYTFGQAKLKYQTQLSECQEQVPVCIKKNDYWTFEVKCDYGDFLQEHTTYRYGNYNDCKYFIDFWLNNEKIKNCEVIE